MSWVALSIIVFPLIYIGYELLKFVRHRRAHAAELARIKKRLEEKRKSEL